MRPSDLAGQRVLVLGVGIDVAAALSTVVAAGPADLVVVDEAPTRAAATLAHLGLDAVPVFTTLAEAPPADVALRSPGFSPYQPSVQERIERGMGTVTPLGLWLCERGDRPSVAITGTKGKSSTSVLAQVALEHLGAPAVVLGNIGVPPWSQPPECPEVAVLEVSSYQAADLPLTAPVAAITAIGEDHVGWHGSLERYLADKARVFSAPTPGAHRWCGAPDGMALPAAFDGIDFARIPVPPGDLRGSNAAMAAAVALAAVGGPAEDLPALVEHLLAHYPDLPGRFSTVATIAALEFIDDALASNPLGLAAALRSLSGRPVTVIVGGADRGASIEPVLAALADRAERGVSTLVLCIDDAEAIVARYGSSGVAAEPAGDVEAAVAVAAARTEAGGAVLLSPGMPTPAPQGGWSDRSSRFRAAVDHHRHP